jgi:hypothetical protein
VFQANSIPSIAPGSGTKPVRESSYARVKRNLEAANAASDATEYLTTAERKRFFVRRKPPSEYEQRQLSSFIAEDHELYEVADSLIDSGCYVAGGAVASMVIDEFDKAGDIDVFCEGMYEFKDAILRLSKIGYKADVIELNHCLDNPQDVKFLELKNPNYTRPVQMIKMVWYDDPYDIISSFDFTFVKFFIRNREIIYDRVGWEDLHEKRIVVTNSLFPVSMIRRIQKYCDRGFTMNDGNMDDIRTMLTIPAKVEQPIESALDTLLTGETTSLWSNPEYQHDYHHLDPLSLRRKWGKR